MQKSKLTLLCTFAALEDNQKNSKLIQQIYDNYNPSRVFIYKYIFLEKEHCIITYNPTVNKHKLENTISIHRKKETNTLFSLNAINEYIRSINNGILDTSIMIDWSQFNNCFLISNSVYSFYKAPLTFIGILDL